MEIDIFDNGLTIEECYTGNHRTACRGIVKKGDLYLVTRLLKWDITMFPGGGLEKDETLEERVKREVLEETGIVVKVLSKNLSINEYFIDSSWTNHYFICEFVEDTGKNSLTDEEKELGLVVEWRDLDYLLDNFENNYTKHSHGVNVHNREFLGLVNSL